MLPSVERLHLALDLFVSGVDLQRPRLRRAPPPDENAEEIESLRAR